MREILANLVVGANGATTLDGSSRRLSFPADRERFKNLRAIARALVIGGQTYRTEPYEKVSIPLYVATRRDAVGSNLINANFIDKTPTEVIDQALKEQGYPILIEGGINFISELIGKRTITTLFLTRSQTAGDSLFLDEKLLRSNYELVVAEPVSGGSLETWKPISQ
jgi:dihydrofolate reductase